MISELRMLLQHLHQPEYIHVLINPSPLWGMMIGAAMLLGALVVHSMPVRKASLLLIMVIGFGTWGVVKYGQRGYDRVYAMSNPDAQQWLDVHMARAEKTQYVFYITGLLALGALIMSLKGTTGGKVLSLVTLLLSVICVGLGGWISHPGGQVRHSEFREGPPPAEILPAHHHHDD